MDSNPQPPPAGAFRGQAQGHMKGKPGLAMRGLAMLILLIVTIGLWVRGRATHTRDPVEIIPANGVNGAGTAENAGPVNHACSTWTWTTGHSHSNNVCMLVRTFAGQLAFLPTFLANLAHGSVPLKILLLPTDATTPRLELQRIVNSTLNYLGCPNLAKVLDIPQSAALSLRQKYVAPAAATGGCRSDNPTVEPCSDAGYAYTDAALDVLFGSDNSRNGENCDYLILTNGDNLYSTSFLSHLLPWMYNGEHGPADVITWDFTTRYSNDQWTQPTDPDVTGVGPNFVIYSELKTDKIDLGAAMFRTAYLRSLTLSRPSSSGGRGNSGPPLRFLSNVAQHYLNSTPATAPPPHFLYDFYRADGNFVEEFAHRTRMDEEAGIKGPGIGPKLAAKRRRRAIVRRVLMMHQ